jgi:hypothetical protein
MVSPGRDARIISVCDLEQTSGIDRVFCRPSFDATDGLTTQT